MGAVVLFDGVCNFCDHSVNFVIEHDKAGYFKFAPLQSDTGRKLAEKYGFVSETSGVAPGNGCIAIDSVILIENDRVYTHSTAALRIVKHLGFPWSLLYAFVIVPAAMRDYFYKLFAKYRYSLFGKKDQCMLPGPDVRARFLT